MITENGGTQTIFITTPRHNNPILSYETPFKHWYGTSRTNRGITKDPPQSIKYPGLSSSRISPHIVSKSVCIDCLSRNLVTTGNLPPFFGIYIQFRFCSLQVDQKFITAMIFINLSPKEPTMFSHFFQRPPPLRSSYSDIALSDSP